MNFTQGLSGYIFCVQPVNRGVLINTCPKMCFGTGQGLSKAKECARMWVGLPSAGNVETSLSALPSLEFVTFKGGLEEPEGS